MCVLENAFGRLGGLFNRAPSDRLREPEASVGPTEISAAPWRDHGPASPVTFDGNFRFLGSFGATMQSAPATSQLRQGLLGSGRLFKWT